MSEASMTRRQKRWMLERDESYKAMKNQRPIFVAGKSEADEDTDPQPVGEFVKKWGKLGK